MHQKLWVFDDLHVYVGSANMDWRSFTQVKELGVVVKDCPEVAADVTRYFEVWWKLAHVDAKAHTTVARDPKAQIWRRVPAWSELVPAPERAPSPFDGDAYATRLGVESPLRVDLNGSPGSLFVTGCPREAKGKGRTFDGDGLVHTIRDARRSICLSVMDFVPLSLYYRSGDADLATREDPALLDAPVWWPDLIDELLHATLTRRVWVRLLVSKWAQTSPLIQPYLRALQQAADSGRASPSQTGGLLEIKSFIVPGWDQTSTAGSKYAPSSRVNHAKYVVTDRRVNVGTSNMSWDYFSNTAGASFNADHPDLVRDLQAIFDRDWTSRYAAPLAAP
jgi:phospholipase D3/4